MAGALIESATAQIGTAAGKAVGDLLQEAIIAEFARHGVAAEDDRVELVAARLRAKRRELRDEMSRDYTVWKIMVFVCSGFLGYCVVNG